MILSSLDFIKFINVSGQKREQKYLTRSADRMSKKKRNYTKNLKGLDYKTLIINVDMTGVSLDILSNLITQIEGHSNEEQNAGTSCNLLWNFYQIDDNGNIQTHDNTNEDDYAKIGTSDYFTGTILAPGVNVQYGALNGSVIAQKTKSNAKESHNWRYTGNTTEVVLPPSETPMPSPSATPTPTLKQIEISVSKVWDDANDKDGLRPESIKVQLYANGEAQGKKVTLNDPNEWTYTWKNLDEQKDAINPLSVA